MAIRVPLFDTIAFVAVGTLLSFMAVNTPREDVKYATVGVVVGCFVLAAMLYWLGYNRALEDCIDG